MLSAHATGCVGDDPSTISGPRGSAARLLTEHECVKGAPTQEPAIAHWGRRCEHPSQGDHPQNWRATSQRPAGRSYAFNTADVHAPLVFYVMVSVGLFFFFCVVTRALAPAVFRVFPFPCSFLVAFPRGGEVVRPCRHSVQPLASFGQCSYQILFLVLSS